MLDAIAKLVEAHGLVRVLKGLEWTMLHTAAGITGARETIVFDLACRKVQDAHETLKSLEK